MICHSSMSVSHAGGGAEEAQSEPHLDDFPKTYVLIGVWAGCFLLALSSKFLCAADDACERTQLRAVTPRPHCMKMNRNDVTLELASTVSTPRTW